MSTAEDGRRRAEQYLRLVAAGEQSAADELLAGVTDLAELTYVGAAFTAISRSGARTLSPAHRAQATGRHMRLTALRDSAKRDPSALRTWLAALAGEAVFVRGMLDVAAARAAQDGTVSGAG